MKDGEEKKRGFGTIAVRGGEERPFLFDPSSTPIYQTSTFFFKDTGEAEAVLRGEREGFLYSRLGNPTIRAFEEKMALLEGGEAAVAFASGMAAISAVLAAILRPGDEVLASRHLYAGSKIYLDQTLPVFGCSVRYFDPMADLGETLPALVTEKTRLLFFETPSNPELTIIDMGLVAGIAQRHRLFSVMDNTFATPCLQQPLASGIDCIVHSATKYIGGHGDAIGGIVVGSREFLDRLRGTMLMNLGACLSPFHAWLFLRGLKTLHVRMERHCASAGRIARFLKDHPKVRSVLYPGLEEHQGHQVAARQMKNFGGMVSFRLADRESCRRFLDNLSLCRIGVSLGDVETLIMNAALMFHFRLSDAECLRIGVDPTLIRISTGLEEVEDILEDLERGLAAV